MSEELKNKREKIKTEIEILLANFALTYHKNLKFNNQEIDYKIQEYLNKLFNIMSTYQDDDRMLRISDVLVDIDRMYIIKNDYNMLIFLTNDRKKYELYDNVVIYDVDNSTSNIKYFESCDCVVFVTTTEL